MDDFARTIVGAEAGDRDTVALYEYLLYMRNSTIYTSVIYEWAGHKNQESFALTLEKPSSLSG